MSPPAGGGAPTAADEALARVGDSQMGAEDFRTVGGRLWSRSAEPTIALRPVGQVDLAVARVLLVRTSGGLDWPPSSTPRTT